MLLVYIINHLLAVREILGQEVHRIPQIVRTPILPVLDDAVERHLQLTILIDDALRLAGSLITFLRLPIAVGPQREHRHIARQIAHLGYHTVSRTSIHEVIVNPLAHFGIEGHALSIILEERRRIVLPIEPPALDALQYILEVLQVRLLHTFLGTATVHLAVLNRA